MWRRGGGIFNRAVYCTYLVSWETTETFPLCLLHKNRNGSSAGCLLCKLRSWRQQTPKPTGSWVHAHARLGMLLSPPWAFSSMVGQDPCLWLPSRTSISGQAQRQVSKARNRNITRRCQKKWRDRSYTLSVSVPAQGTGCSVAVSGRADGMYVPKSEGLWEMHHWQELNLHCFGMRGQYLGVYMN